MKMIIEETKEMKTLGTGMSNFDRQIDDGLEKRLRNVSGRLFTGYASRDFYAHVWFTGKEFRAEVRQLGKVVGFVNAENLSGIMNKVSDKYGWE